MDLANNDVKLEGNVVLLTKDRYDEALSFLKEHFVPDEPMFKSLGIQWSEELADIRFRSAFELNLSVVLEDLESHDIIAIRSTRIVKRGSRLDPNTINDVLLRELIRAESIADERANFFNHYGIDEAIQFLGLGVHRKHRGKGLATKLTKFYIKFLRYLGVFPVHVKVEGSSNYSKNIYQNLGFETLYELKFLNYFVDDKQVFGDTGFHKSVRCYGYKVC